MKESKKITIEIVVNVPIEKVWYIWTEPEQIKKWAYASDTWEVGEVVNDLQIGGKFKTVMRAKDGSTGFDFEGLYTEVIPNKKISYEMSDGRCVQVTFEEVEGGVKVVETFDIENENSEEMQKDGWQSILENYKKACEE